MLYQSDYWVATGVLEQKETIINFLETDAGITSLVILDHRNDTTTTIKEIIEGVYKEATECNLRFCTAKYQILRESTPPLGELA